MNLSALDTLWNRVYTEIYKSNYKLRARADLLIAARKNVFDSDQLQTAYQFIEYDNVGIFMEDIIEIIAVKLSKYAFSQLGTRAKQ
jgi:hypothetical protein